MGYASTFMATTMQSVADFHQHLGALISLLTTDSTTLHNQATSLRAMSIQGATADALVTITETYHDYVGKNTNPVNQIVGATQKFHDVMNTASATCDHAIGTNTIAEYLFVTQPSLTVAAILDDPYGAVDTAVAAAYKALAYPGGVPVRDGPMTVYDTDQQAAQNALETWANAVQSAYIDWTNALGNDSSTLPTNVPGISGVTVDPKEVQTLFNDINAISAPNGVVNAHLSNQDTVTAINLYNDWASKAPGLTLGFIEALLASKFSTAQITALLGLWPKIDWKTWVVEGVLLIRLAAGGVHLFVEKNLDVTNNNPPRPPTSQPAKGTSSKEGADGGNDPPEPTDDGEMTFKAADGSTITVKFNKSDTTPPTTGGDPAGGSGTTDTSGDTPLGPEEPIDPLEPFGPGDLPLDI